MARDRRPRKTELENAGLLLRAQLHAALAEPIRLAMVERLLLTDASPGELGAPYGLATNVLAHHLKVLQAAGLVRRIRSEGDARRAYVQLCLDDPEVRALVDCPSSGGMTPGDGLPPAGARHPERVVFVCTHNSARSQLAAAAWQQASRVPVASAGTRPAPCVHPRAVATGSRHGLRIDGTRTARLTDVAAPGDLVVCVCDNAHEELTTGSSGSLVEVPIAGSVHWAVPDPVRVDTDDAFETAYTQIADRIGRLARALAPGLPPIRPESLFVPMMGT
jgi:protein-tyrosine-phosphatase/DNA-binding transcriptional ArsR family regulator